ncbi:MAG TPA: glutamine synthetase [Candidatus Aerophobetes bacterium]|uniref:Glutamine synthetase n=1 Tax=Aerophobetes bacterium TaxID=2030807 RepID=A0A7C1RAS7_UNCAE|nr:glutamine synthetase [Candidatus Aerophobetes bacterium]
MQIKNKEWVLEEIRMKKVEFIRLWFTDILGFLKSFAITVEGLEAALEEGVGFDGSSIEGFARIEESDMIAMPDPSTFSLMPSSSSNQLGVMAKMFCDILKPDGNPYAEDPRYVLKRNLKRASDVGYTFYVGPELEYFYFQSSQVPPQGLDKGGYFDLTPRDVASDFRRETVLTLKKMNIEVECSHHEVAPSQHEIDLKYTNALDMADNTMTARLMIKEIALKNNLYATFMPKPLFGENGSGMHIHQSLFKGEVNAFFDSQDEWHLSKIAKRYIAGLLRHASEFTLITNQWVNSYKRLVPGYEAPTYLSWALRNRSDLIRVPLYKPGKEIATRVELRSPDPACNPYLSFAVALSAGLEGIEKEYDIVEPVKTNVYKMSEKERKEKGIGQLPENLWQAIKVAEESVWLKETLGEPLFFKLIENKRIEWENYRSRVTSYELEQYLPIL